MPLVTSQAPDNTEFAPTGPVSTPPIPPPPIDDQGTGANGPKYSALDVWAGALRSTVVGRYFSNKDIESRTGSATYAPWMPAPGERLSTEAAEAMIPKEMLPWADKYVDLHTAGEIQARTQELQQGFKDDEAMNSSKWGWIARIAAAQSDPIGAASLAIPIAGETRLANIIRAAIVGGGVSAADEFIMHRLDPTATLGQSVQNVGEGAILAGLLGAFVRGQVPKEEFERLRARLKADFEARLNSPLRIPEGDTADKIAADLVAAAEGHAAGLEAIAAAGGKSEAEVAARLQAAQERLQAAGPEPVPEQRAEDIRAEAERLTQPEAVQKRLEETYGDKLPEVIQQRAEANVTAKQAADEAERTAAQRDVEAAKQDLAQTRAAAQATEDLKALIEPPTVKKGAEPLPGSPAPAVESTILDQLQQVGRFDDKVNRTYASFIANAYATQAARLGLTADEFFQRYPLRIAREGATDGLFQRGVMEEPVREAAAAGYHVEQGELTDELRAKFEGLRSQLPAAEGARTAGGREPGQSVSGGAPGGGARPAETGRGGAGEPLSVFRGGRGGPIGPEHFAPESRGIASGHPSSGIGVFFTSRAAEAAGYGKVTEHHLDIRNPLEIKVEDLPGFNSLEEARAWREKQEAAGHDGIVIDSSHLGGPTWYVPFKFEQVLRPPAVAASAAEQTRARLDALLEKASRRQAMEAQGQDILDRLDETRRTPREVSEEFWSKTYPLLGPDGKRLFERQAKAMGFEPGSTATYEPKTGATTKLADWQDVGRFLGEDMPQRAEHLEGGQRGYVALMEWANENARVHNEVPRGTPQLPFRQELRGSFDPATKTIALLDQADPSTFLHETGHHFLDIAGTLAQQADAPLEVRQDFETLLDWFGVKDADAWHGMTMEEQRPFHEQFAKGFEAYLREGVAPSVRLQGIFDKFRDWLTKIYTALKGQTDLTPEVRGVMDRMVASQAEIDAARQARIDKATTLEGKRLAGDENLRQTLRVMAAHEAGWAEVGGLHPEGSAEGFRTAWIPRADWWPGRPGGYSREEVSNAVDKALAGERLGSKQQQLVEYMTKVADERIAHEPFMPHEEVLRQSELEPTAQNAHEVAMVTRLRAIDEDTVETLARHFEDDDVGFKRAVKERLDAYDEDARISRSVPQELAAPGEPAHGAAAERPAGAPVGEGRGAEGAGAAGRGAASAEGGGAGEGGRGPGNAEPAAAGATGGAGIGGAGEPAGAGTVGGIDLAALLARLPPELRAPFEARIQALEHPSMIAAPESSTVGASAVHAGEDLADYGLARGGRVLGRLLGWFAPGSRLLSSPSINVRRASVRLLETHETLGMNMPTPEFPNGRPTPLAVERILKGWEGRWAVAHAMKDELFRAYQERPLAPGEVPKHDMATFNEEVSAAMRRGDVHPIEEVQKTAAMYRKVVFDPLKVAAQKLGLLPMQEDLLMGTAESYLMRQYDRAKINADPIGWHQALHDGFVAQGVESAEAHDIAHGVTRNILGTEFGFLDLNSTVFKGIVPQSGRLISRQLLLPDRVLEPFLVNDIDRLSEAYLKSLAPQVEITRWMGDKDLAGVAKEITDEYAILKQRAMAGGDVKTVNQLQDRQKADLRDLLAIRDRLYGLYGAPSDPSSWIVRAGRVMRSVNMTRLLGTATWSHVPDLANVIMARGLPTTMATAAKLATSLDTLNLTRAEMHRIGAAMDMVHNSTAAQLGEFGVHSDYAVQKTLNRATRAFTIATLETPWIASCKMWAGAAAHDEILDIATRAAAGEALSDAERIRMNTMGLDQGMLERIAGQFQEFGQTSNGLRFGMSDKWRDKGAAMHLDAATIGAAEASTLHPSKGDTPLWTSSEVGKAIFQFKTFGAVAIRKVVIPLAQGLARGELRAAQGLATLIAAGAFTYTMKQKLSGQPIEKDPQRYALEVLDKSNLLGWVGEYFYPSLWQFGIGNFSRWGDRQTWETIGGPVAGEAVDAWDLRLPGKIKGQLTKNPNDAHFTRGDVHRIRRMLPGNQIWYGRRLVNALEQKVGDWMGLAPEAPRGSTE